MEALGWLSQHTMLVPGHEVATADMRQFRTLEAGIEPISHLVQRFHKEQGGPLDIVGAHLPMCEAFVSQLQSAVSESGGEFRDFTLLLGYVAAHASYRAVLPEKREEWLSELSKISKYFLADMTRNAAPRTR